MAWLPLILSWSAILLAAGLRYRDVGLLHAAPLSLSPILWAALTVLSLLATAAIWWRHRVWLKGTSGARRALVELMIFPLLFFLVWAWLPSGERQPLHFAVAVGVLAGMGLLLLRDPGGRALLGSARSFDSARRSLLLPTLLMIAPALGFYFRDPVPLEAQRVLRSLVTYPFYAFVQLAIFLIFTQTRIRKLQASSLALVLAPAGLFALVHWPNPPLMLATFVAMAVWAMIELRHPSLPALAVSMAVLATVYTQFLPENINAHLRVGPGYVFHAQLDEVYAEQAALEDHCVTKAFYEEAGGSIATYNRALFDTILQGQATPGELERFTRQWELQWHARAAAAFERARMEKDGLRVDEAACVQRGEELAADWLNDDGAKRMPDDRASWTAFITSLYREVLDREGSPGEIASWSPDPDISFRRAMIHAVFKEPAFFRRTGTAAARLRLLRPLIPRPPSN